MSVKPSAETLVEQHLDALYGLAKAWTRDPDLAQDLVHRSFLKAFERRGQLRDPASARAWLVAILRHEIAGEHRARGRFLDWDAEDFENLPQAEEPEEAWRPDLLEGLQAALDRLADGHRQVLLLRYQQELSYEAIAGILGVALGTVMSRLHRAKTALKVELAADEPEGRVSG